MKRQNHFRKMWEDCHNSFPVLDAVYTFGEKRKKEKKLDNFLKTLKAGIQRRDLYNEELNSELFFEKMEQFFREGLDYSDEQLAVILSPEMIDSTVDFVTEARRFDPLLSLDNIFQACRNVWIMNGIQYIMNVPVELSPSVFAYSMLYPYSDNLVDDPLISNHEKMEFSSRFASRLKGTKFQAKNRTEEKIHELVCMIEDEWDRQTYPGVYQSLLDIHKAQTDSIFLLSKNELSEDDIFRICIEKGGTSVVADGYLILGNLNANQEQFLFDYGAYLQLLDDLQDSSEDLSNGLITSFSGACDKGNLEELMCRTFHLGFQIMNEVDLLNTSDSAAFKSLMKKSIDLFLIEAVVTNHSFFHRRFIRKMEIYSPFRFSYIRKRSTTLSPYQKLLFQNIEEYAFRSIKRETPFLLNTA